jgi:Tol biopolymer transport system component
MRSVPAKVFVGAFGIVFGLVAPAQASFPGKNGKIAFTRIDRNATYFERIAVSVINTDGSGKTLLASDASSPAWSADGLKLAFVSEGSIWTMSADGSGKTMVAASSAANGGVSGAPSWSPDGHSIAFTRVKCTDEDLSCPSSLRVVNSDGSGERVLPTTDNPGSVHWSPDGTRIAFDGFPFGLGSGSPSDIYTIHPDGTGEIDITNTPEEFEQVYDWLPDGSRIFGIDEQDYQGYMTMNPDGSGRSPFPHPLLTVQPTLSPDGQKLVFGDFWNIWFSNIDGSGPTQVTGDPQYTSVTNSEPVWQPIPAPKRADYKNASKFCKAEETFWGDQFVERYGGGANAHGKCVSANK